MEKIGVGGRLMEKEDKNLFDWLIGSFSKFCHSEKVILLDEKEFLREAQRILDLEVQRQEHENAVLSLSEAACASSPLSARESAVSEREANLSVWQHELDCQHQLDSQIASLRAELESLPDVAILSARSGSRSRENQIS
jgi:hypothetical protein